MAHSHSKSSKVMQTADFKNLSSKVLCLHLQNLNLPITGSCAWLVNRLRLATNSALAATQVAPEVVLTMDRCTKINLWLQTYAYDRVPMPNVLMSLQNRLTRRLAVLTKTSSRTWTQKWKNCLRDFKPQVSKEAVLSPAQMSFIQETLSTSVKVAEHSFRARFCWCNI